MCGDFADGTAAFGAAAVGNDAKGADVTAAKNNRDVRADEPARVRGRGG